MTRLPDISNLKINNAGAMEALAKGDEMSEINLTAYQDDGDFGKKFIAEQREWIAEFEANPDDGQHNCDASDFSGLLGEALTELERLQSQLAARDALIERLIEVGEFFSGGFEHDAFGVLANGNWFEGYDEGTVRGREFLEEIQSRLHAIVAEWKASKDGGGE